MATSSQILVQTLEKFGVQRVFCVAGESYLPVLDALLEAPAIQVVTCRHESGAAFMAEAHAHLTGSPGVVMVTRGPGACNASIGIHTAKQSSAPVVMFVGLIGTGDRDKEAFQEFDLPQMFASHTKWSAVVDRPERLGEYTARAFHVAMSGRPGPVVLGLPEDILAEAVDEGVREKFKISRIVPDSVHVQTVADVLKGAQRPLVLVGGSLWDDQSCADLEDFVSASHLPVACSFRRQDLFNHAHASYVGELGTGPNPALVKNVGEADVVLVIGARLNEITTQGYTLFKPGQTIIHVHSDAAEFGKSVWPHVAILSDTSPFVAALAGAVRLDGRRWAGWRDSLRAQYLEWTNISMGEFSNWQGADMTQIFGHLRELLPRDAIVTTDAGNFSGWAQRYLRYGRPGRLLAPVSGAMGYAVPSAVAAALEQPGRVVLGLCGDGGFMMTAQELATAMRYNAAPIIMVCNNSMFGTIRMHQERDFPGRVSATDLTNPDFVNLAQSYGAFGARVQKAEEFPDVWNAARKSGRAALIEIVMDPRQITTRAKA